MLSWPKGVYQHRRADRVLRHSPDFEPDKEQRDRILLYRSVECQIKGFNVIRSLSL